MSVIVSEENLFLWMAVRKAVRWLDKKIDELPPEMLRARPLRMNKEVKALFRAFADLNEFLDGVECDIAYGREDIERPLTKRKIERAFKEAWAEANGQQKSLRPIRLYKKPMKEAGN